MCSAPQRHMQGQVCFVWVLDQTMKSCWLNCIIHFVPFILINNGYFWFLFINSYVSLFCRAGLVLILTKMASFKKNFFQPPSAHIGPILGVSIPVLDQTMKSCWLNCIIHFVPFILIKNGYFWFLFIHSYVSLFCRAGLVLILTKMASFKKNFFSTSLSSHRTNFRGQHTCIRPDNEKKLIKLHYPFCSLYFDQKRLFLIFIHKFLCFPVLQGWPGTYFDKNGLLQKKFFFKKPYVTKMSTRPALQSRET